MGKYIKKSTAKSDIAAMEIPKSSVGVRTRAKTLALQKHQHQHHKPPLPAADKIADESSYLQLRSRRLLKLSPLRRSQITAAESESCPNLSSKRAGDKLGLEKVSEGYGSEVRELGIDEFDGSFSENDLDFDAGKIRASRESTPCNSVKVSDSLGTPGSTTRSPRSSLPRPLPRVHNSIQRVMPTASEIEEFFAFAEQQQQRLFLDKYNFDAVSDMPMPGRYEWGPLNP